MIKKENLLLDITKIKDVEIEDIDMGDYPKFCDAMITSAYSTELERDLTELELDWIMTNEYDFFYEEIINTIY